AAPVVAYPPFPGAERELLRAQIARITHGTAVSPAGFFELDEESEEPQIKFAEAEAINEVFPKPLEELKERAGWAHHELELNTLGRCRPMPERLDENGDPIEDEDAPEAVDPLRTLDAEDEEGREEPTWTFRAGPAGSGESANSHVVARSLVWPGAFAVCARQRFLRVRGRRAEARGGPTRRGASAATASGRLTREGGGAAAGAEGVLVDPNPPGGRGGGRLGPARPGPA
ncbi:unnamed protein product, partial [Heterosigma akashiwo]